MSATPDLSIVVITRNRCRLLARCLDSLARLEAPRGSYEIVVVDDGSADDTPEVVRRFRPERAVVASVRQPALGIPAARNAGWRRASAPLVAFVADDYVLPRDYVSHVLSFFARFDDAAAVRFRMAPVEDDACSRACHFYFDVNIRNNLGTAGRAPVSSLGEGWAKLWRRLPDHGTEPTTDHTLAAAGAAAFRRETLRALEGFDQRLPRAEDTDLARRMRQAGLPLYYDPRLAIGKTYSRSFRQASRAERASGYHLARLERRLGTTTSARQLGWTAVCLAARPLWRARQSPSLRSALRLLPFLYRMELAHSLGFAQGALGASAKGEARDPAD